MGTAFVKSLVVGSVCLACSASAQSLFGHQVTLTIEVPLGNVLTVPNTQVVGAGIEFPVGSLVPLPGITISSATRDVGATFIDTVYASAATFGGGFNAAHYQFDASTPLILGVSLDPSSTIAPLLSFSDHDVYINVAGLIAQPGTHTRVNLVLATPVPEPETYVLLLGGLALVPMIGKRRRTPL